MPHANFNLQRDAYGRLVFLAENGIRHEGVTPVRAFPIAAPDEGISLINYEGHEVGWAERLADLPAEIAGLIVEVSSFACPSTWQVATNRGAAQLILKGEEDIRRLSQTRLLIADSHGIQFLVRDLSKLDRQSRKLLDRFL